jgi:hypothetical protein
MKLALKTGLSFLVLVCVIVLFENSRLASPVISQLWGMNQLHYFRFERKLAARALPVVNPRFSIGNSDAEAPAPRADVPGGFHVGPVALHLSGRRVDAVIRYTTDGSIPTTRSRRYTGSLEISRTTSLRFRSYEPGLLPSEVVTQTYVLDPPRGLPVLALVVDPVNLWNSHTGIYTHPEARGSEWERGAYIEYFEKGTRPSLAFPAEVRINGEVSRTDTKKSFRIRYASEAANRGAETAVWTVPGSEKERIVKLRAAGAKHDMLCNTLFDSIYSELGGLISSSIPTILLMNGEFWGIYYVHEQIDEQYLREKVGKASYDLIPNQDSEGQPKAGDGNWWRHTVDYFNAHDLSKQDQFAAAASLIDVQNLTDYWLTNIYAGNVDWPHNNVYCFRSRDRGDKRWKWVAWDSELTFRHGLNIDSLAWATRDRLRDDLALNGKDYEEWLNSTLIVRGLLKNPSYRQEFITRFCDLLNEPFVPQKVEAKLDRILEDLMNDLPADLKRWDVPAERFWGYVDEIRRFIRLRPDILRECFRAHFQLGRSFEIELRQGGSMGSIRINSLRPSAYPWKGTYFEDLPIRLTAVPADGFEFAGWTEASLGKSPSVSLHLRRDVSIGAIFRRAHGSARIASKSLLLHDRP